MTQEEIIRFALMLGEADRVRAMIAEDEAAEGSKEALPRQRPVGIAARRRDRMRAFRRRGSHWQHQPAGHRYP